MSKKSDKKNAAKEEVRDNSSYYTLNTDAVDRLVNADVANSPKVTDEEIRKYTGKGKFRIPTVLKILFTKFWFKGAACFFFYWGLGPYIQSYDLLFVFGFAIGVITDLLENNVFRFFEKEKGDHDKWMMFPRKKFVSLFANIIYAFFVLICVMYLYNLINVTAMSITKNTDKLFLGVEPLLFGLFYLGFDMLFITVKHTFQKIVKDAKEQNKSNRSK
ncbi:MAG: hypothetical protein K6B75_05565 [Lachnospiraceae bacterium]|nr:hypothetical protein [Lachnospiraceae bacterium]